jgi:hypothetical protein
VGAPIECEGAPRDLGLDQGRACADALRARFGARPWWERLWLQAGLAGADRARMLRDVQRYFPHQWETLAGMAVGARVPTGWLAEELARELADAEAALAVVVAIDHGRALLGRGLGGEWVARHSRPEGLFASVEVTRPCLTAALAGVNERGLAVAAVGTRGATERRAAPAALLAQDCLERFEAVEAALEWCLGRPGGGRAAVWLADARGELAGVEFAGAERRVLRPSEGLWVSGAGAAGEAPPLDAPALARRIEGEAVALDPRERHLVAGGLDLSPL